MNLRMWPVFLFVSVVASLALFSPEVRATGAVPENLRCTTADGRPGIRTSIGFDDASGNTVQCLPAEGSDLNSNPIVGLLRSIIQFLAVGIGLVVTGGIVFGGIVYMTARGNAGQVEKAQEIIRNAVIGLLLFLGLFSIINFIVPGGILQ